MILTLDPVLLFVAAVCLALAAFGIAIPRVNLVALGLLCWVATFLTP